MVALHPKSCLYTKKMQEKEKRNPDKNQIRNEDDHELCINRLVHGGHIKEIGS